MKPIEFSGTYQDAAGLEVITWLIHPSDRPGYDGRYEMRTTIRGIEVWGLDFDGLEPVDPADATARERLRLNAAGELSACVLSGDLPCTLEDHGRSEPILVRFDLDLNQDPNEAPRAPGNLRLSTTVNGVEHSVVDDWFEDGVLRLDKALRPSGLRCCVTCLYSDYSPGGHGLMGMRCHRDAKAQYLSVKSKGDYWSVPVTEDVPETYLCDEYEVRRAGTGYRG